MASVINMKPLKYYKSGISVTGLFQDVISKERLAGLNLARLPGSGRPASEN